LLGEWDRVAWRGIISCTSKLARDLEGKAPGARGTMELASGPVECTIAAVSGLPPEIMAWARGEDVAGGNAKSEG